MPGKRFSSRGGWSLRCRFVQEPFQGILVQEDEHSALTSLCASGPVLDNPCQRKVLAAQ
ncbi:MAG: hypothetical protein ACLTDS_01310 [Bianqueaceae bacterium]